MTMVTVVASAVSLVVGVVVGAFGMIYGISVLIKDDWDFIAKLRKDYVSKNESESGINEG